MTCIILPVKRLTLAKGKGKEGKGKERKGGEEMGRKWKGRGGHRLLALAFQPCVGKQRITFNPSLHPRSR